MYKRLICFIITVVLSFGITVPAYAYDTDEHNEHVELVLFGDRQYKASHADQTDKIEAIEDALYLCIDQYNGEGQKKLDFLNNRGVPDLPDKVDDFDFGGNYAHRGPTHSGWNAMHPKKCNWPIRKQILMNTVRHELFSDSGTPLEWFPWLEERLFSGQVSRRNDEERQCESFCMLLYNVHTLGDNIHAGDDGRNSNDGPLTLKQKTTGLAYVNRLTNPNDRDNPGIIPDLKECLAVLLRDRSGTRVYRQLMNELDEHKRTSDRLYASKGGVNTEEELDEYVKCANDVLDALGRYVPDLLDREDFFKEAFAV